MCVLHGVGKLCAGDGFHRGFLAHTNTRGEWKAGEEGGTPPCHTTKQTDGTLAKVEAGCRGSDSQRAERRVCVNLARRRTKSNPCGGGGTKGEDTP